ncbi:hypothetical protein GMRT_12676 [Giardia muris]|uniref:Uncharacterized protein n=1 Tax=Giardia muris TaxID=5742 RepID=A0A4Z1SWF6_GIAMU|nr:hypothetical protein GMRT_12676 [Giardia muris]|eukprot:TNJ27868.1 hypothetical protein GMRT_12676 [Giardia muris]
MGLDERTIALLCIGLSCYAYTYLMGFYRRDQVALVREVCICSGDFGENFMECAFNGYNQVFQSFILMFVFTCIFVALIVAACITGMATCCCRPPWLKFLQIVGFGIGIPALIDLIAYSLSTLVVAVIIVISSDITGTTRANDLNSLTMEKVCSGFAKLQDLNTSLDPTKIQEYIPPIFTIAYSIGMSGGISMVALGTAWFLTTAFGPPLFQAAKCGGCCKRFIVCIVFAIVSAGLTFLFFVIDVLEARRQAETRYKSLFNPTFYYITAFIQAIAMALLYLCLYARITCCLQRGCCCCCCCCCSKGGCCKKESKGSKSSKDELSISNLAPLAAETETKLNGSFGFSDLQQNLAETGAKTELVDNI